MGFKQLRRVLALFVAMFSLGLQHLQAQSFLSCNQQKTDDQELSASLFENHGEIRMILHALAGDDLLAYLGSSPEISEYRSEQPNAFSVGPNRIFLTSSLLEMISSSSELAFVLAHEIAHLKYDRQGIKLFLNGQGENQQENILKIELRADSEAMKMLAKSGFDSNAAGIFLKRIRDLSPSQGSSSSFNMSLDLRISAMDKHSKSGPTD